MYIYIKHSTKHLVLPIHAHNPEVICRLFSTVKSTIHLLEVNKSKDSQRNKRILFFSLLKISTSAYEYYELELII